jgi:hypothetical protein
VTGSSLQPGVSAALAELTGYMLALDAERRRLGEPADLTEELDALSTTIDALRASAERLATARGKPAPSAYTRPLRTARTAA